MPKGGVTGRGVRQVSVLAVLLAFCGIAASAQAASTRGEYIAQVDPICANANARFSKATRGVNHNLQNGKWRAAARKIDRGMAIFSEAVNQIVLVTPPAEDTALIDQWIAMLRSQVPLAKRVTILLRRGVRARRVNRAIDRLFDVSDQTKALVSGYGFVSCNDF
jgi:hypothetical protein